MEPISRLSPSWAMTVGDPPPDGWITNCIGVQPVKVPGKKPMGSHRTVPSITELLEFVGQCGSVAAVVPPPDVWKFRPKTWLFAATDWPPG